MQFRYQDFRSTDGLYNLVKAQYPNAVVRGRDLFDAVLWTDPVSTALFYTFLANLRKEVLNVKDTSSVHKLIKTLSDTGRLMRCYTQNIDGLEEREGLVSGLSYGKGKRKRPSPHIMEDDRTDQEKGCQVVQLHGNLKTLRCTNCHLLTEYSESSVGTLLLGVAPTCIACATASKCRQDAGKRATRVGLLRPNVVLYGEEHPDGDMVGALAEADLGANPDMLLILGTSLKVHGLKRMVKEFAAAVHTRKGLVVFINNTSPAESVWGDVIDYHVSMDCDSWVADVRAKHPAIWERQSRLPIRKSVKSVKPTDHEKENAQAKRKVLEPKTPSKAKKALAVSKVFGAETPYISPPPSRKRGGKKNCYNAGRSQQESEVHRTPVKRQKIYDGLSPSTLSPPETPSLAKRMISVTITTPTKMGSPKKQPVEIFEDVDSMIAKATPSRRGRGAGLGTESNTRAMIEMPEIIATPAGRGRKAGSAIKLQIQTESGETDEEAKARKPLPRTTPRKAVSSQAPPEIAAIVPVVLVAAAMPALTRRRSMRNTKATVEAIEA